MSASSHDDLPPTPPPPQQPPQSTAAAATTTATPQFPFHAAPRVWFLTCGNSPIGIALTRRLLDHGDVVVSGVDPRDWEARREAYASIAEPSSSSSPSSSPSPAPDRFRALLNAVKTDPARAERLLVAELDVGVPSSVQSALAAALARFRRLDVLLLCNAGGSLLGTVEELGRSEHATSFVKRQFRSAFFGPVDVIRGALPQMRAQRGGHIVLLTGITGHLGTPGLGATCASQWAIEGYVDSLAYEVAPFNVKLSIVQSNLEVGVLTNKVAAVPEMREYRREGGNEAPLARGLIGGLVGRLAEASGVEASSSSSWLSGDGDGDTADVDEVYPLLPQEFEESLVAETVFAVLAIGGHENPPARHIVGHEGVASVKEKLKTVSEELEEFVEVSGSVDFVPAANLKARG